MEDKRYRVSVSATFTVEVYADDEEDAVWQAENELGDLGGISLPLSSVEVRCDDPVEIPEVPLTEEQRKAVEERRKAVLEAVRLEQEAGAA